MGAENARRIAPALIALMVILPPTVFAAPVSESTEIEEYHDGGCYYNFQHYGEGDRIMTNEPCLNCTCHNRMLMCYLRVCPFTKAIGQDCTVEKRGDQCCPIITCPDVPVDLLTSTTSSPIDSTEVGHHDNYGCSIDNKFYTDGARVPSNPDKPCELCYCIRNMTSCVMQECTLHVEGCTPVYHKGVCCPVRYSCDYPEDEGPLMLDDMTTTVRPTPGFILTTTMAPGASMECTYNDLIFGDGALIATDKDCEHCYCMKGDIVCAVQECGTPMENEGKNCTALAPREGQCCPDSYECEETESITTDITPLDVVTEAEKETPGHGIIESDDHKHDEEVTEKEGLTTHSQSDLVTQIRDNKGENEIIDDDLVQSIFTTKLPSHRDDTVAESYPTVKESHVTERTGDEKEATDAPSDIEHPTEHDIEDEVPEHVTKVHKPDTELESDEHIKSDDESTELPEKFTKHHDEEPLEDVSHKEPSHIPDSQETEIDHTTESIHKTEISTDKAHPLDEMFEGSGHIEHPSTPTHRDDADVTKHDDDETSFETDEVILMNTTEKPVDEDHEIKHTTSDHIPEHSTTEKSHADKDIGEDDHTPIYESSGGHELTDDMTQTTLSSEHGVRSETTAGVDVTPTKDSSHIDQHSTEYDDRIIFRDEDDKDEFTSPHKGPSTVSTIAVHDEDHHITKAEHDDSNKLEGDVTQKATSKLDDGETVTKSSVDDTETTDAVEHDLSQSTEKEIVEKTTEAADHTVRTDIHDDLGETKPSEAVTEGHIDEHDDEIMVHEPPRIPGEGDCLLDGISYRNNTTVATMNRCQTSCRCINSIVKCENIDCPPPPTHMVNCQPVYHGKETCCPTYTCEHQEQVTIQTGNQMYDHTQHPDVTEKAVQTDDEAEKDKSDESEEDIFLHVDHTTVSPIVHDADVKQTVEYDDKMKTEKPVHHIPDDFEQKPEDDHTVSPIHKPHGEEVSEEPILPNVYLPDCGSEGCFFDTTKPGQELKTTTDEIDQLAFAHTTLRPSVGTEFDQKTESPIISDVEKSTDGPAYHVTDHDDEQVKITVDSISGVDKEHDEKIHETTEPSSDHETSQYDEKEVDTSSEEQITDDDEHKVTLPEVVKDDDEHKVTSPEVIKDDDEHKVTSPAGIKDDESSTTIKSHVEATTKHDIFDDTHVSTEDIGETVSKTESPDVGTTYEDRYGDDKGEVEPEAETPSHDVTTEKHVQITDGKVSTDDEVTTIRSMDDEDHTTGVKEHTDSDDTQKPVDRHEVTEPSDDSDESSESPDYTQKHDDHVEDEHLTFKSPDDSEMMKIDTTISPIDDEFRTTLISDEKEVDEKKHTTAAEDISTNIVDDVVESSTEMKIDSKTTESITTASPIVKTTVSSDGVNEVGVSVLPTDTVDEDCGVSGCGPKDSDHVPGHVGHEEPTTQESIIKSDCSGQECEYVPHVTPVEKLPACDGQGCVEDEQQNVIADDLDKPHVTEHGPSTHDDKEVTKVDKDIPTEAPIHTDDEHKVTVTQLVGDSTEKSTDHKVSDEDATLEPGTDNEIFAQQTDKPEKEISSEDCQGDECGESPKPTAIPMRGDITPSDHEITTEHEKIDDFSNEVIDDQHEVKFPEKDLSQSGVTKVPEQQPEKIPEDDLTQSGVTEVPDKHTDKIPEDDLSQAGVTEVPDKHTEKIPEDDLSQAGVTEVPDKHTEKYPEEDLSQSGITEVPDKHTDKIHDDDLIPSGVTEVPDKHTEKIPEDDLTPSGVTEVPDKHTEKFPEEDLSQSGITEVPDKHTDKIHDDDLIPSGVTEVPDKHTEKIPEDDLTQSGVTEVPDKHTEKIHEDDMTQSGVTEVPDKHTEKYPEEDLSQSGITEVPDKHTEKIPEDDLTQSGVTEVPDKHTEKIHEDDLTQSGVTEVPDKHTEKFPEEDLSQSGITEVPDKHTEKIHDDDLIPSGVTEVPDKHTEKIPEDDLTPSGVTEVPDKHTEKFPEEDLSQSGITEVPDKHTDKIHDDDLIPSGVTEVPDKHTEKIPEDDLTQSGVTEVPDKHTEKIPEDDLTQSGVTEVPDKHTEKIPADDLTQSGVTEVPDKHTEKIPEDDLTQSGVTEVPDKHTDKTPEDDLTQSGVTEVPDKHTEDDLTQSGVTEVPDKHAEKIPEDDLTQSGITEVPDKHTEKIHEDDLTQSGVTEVPDKHTEDDLTQSGVTEVPDKHTEKIHEDDLTQSGVTEVPDKHTEDDLTQSGVTEVPDKHTEKIPEDDLTQSGVTEVPDKHTEKIPEEDLTQSGVTEVPDKHTEKIHEDDLTQSGVTEVPDKHTEKFPEEDLSQSGITEVPDKHTEKIHEDDLTQSEVTEVPDHDKPESDISETSTEYDVIPSVEATIKPVDKTKDDKPDKVCLGNRCQFGSEDDTEDHTDKQETEPIDIGAHPTTHVGGISDEEVTTKDHVDISEEDRTTLAPKVKDDHSTPIVDKESSEATEIPSIVGDEHTTPLSLDESPHTYLPPKSEVTLSDSEVTVQTTEYPSQEKETPAIDHVKDHVEDEHKSTTVSSKIPDDEMTEIAHVSEVFPGFSTESPIDQHQQFIIRDHTITEHSTETDKHVSAEVTEIPEKSDVTGHIPTQSSAIEKDVTKTTDVGETSSSEETSDETSKEEDDKHDFEYTTIPTVKVVTDIVTKADYTTRTPTIVDDEKEPGHGQIDEHEETQKPVDDVTHKPIIKDDVGKVPEDDHADEDKPTEPMDEDATHEPSVKDHEKQPDHSMIDEDQHTEGPIKQYTTLKPISSMKDDEKETEDVGITGATEDTISDYTTHKSTIIADDGKVTEHDEMHVEKDSHTGRPMDEFTTHKPVISTDDEKEPEHDDIDKDKPESIDEYTTRKSVTEIEDSKTTVFDDIDEDEQEPSDTFTTHKSITGIDEEKKPEDDHIDKDKPIEIPEPIDVFTTHAPVTSTEDEKEPEHDQDEPIQTQQPSDDITTDKSVTGIEDGKKPEHDHVDKDKSTQEPIDEFATHKPVTVVEDEKKPEDDHIDEYKPTEAQEPIDEFTTHIPVTAIKDEKKPEHGHVDEDEPIQTQQPIDESITHKPVIVDVHEIGEPIEDSTTHEPIIEDEHKEVQKEPGQIDDGKESVTETPDLKDHTLGHEVTDKVVTPDEQIKDHTTEVPTSVKDGEKLPEDDETAAGVTSATGEPIEDHTQQIDIVDEKHKPGHDDVSTEEPIEEHTTEISDDDKHKPVDGKVGATEEPIKDVGTSTESSDEEETDKPVYHTDKPVHIPDVTSIKIDETSDDEHVTKPTTDDELLSQKPITPDHGVTETSEDEVKQEVETEPSVKVTEEITDRPEVLTKTEQPIVHKVTETTGKPVTDIYEHPTELYEDEKSTEKMPLESDDHIKEAEKQDEDIFTIKDVPDQVDVTEPSIFDDHVKHTYADRVAEDDTEAGQEKDTEKPYFETIDKHTTEKIKDDVTVEPHKEFTEGVTDVTKPLVEQGTEKTHVSEKEKDEAEPAVTTIHPYTLIHEHIAEHITEQTKLPSHIPTHVPEDDKSSEEDLSEEIKTEKPSDEDIPSDDDHEQKTTLKYDLAEQMTEKYDDSSIAHDTEAPHHDVEQSTEGAEKITTEKPVHEEVSVKHDVTEPIEVVTEHVRPDDEIAEDDEKKTDKPVHHVTEQPEKVSDDKDADVTTIQSDEIAATEKPVESDEKTHITTVSSVEEEVKSTTAAHIDVAHDTSAELDTSSEEGTTKSYDSDEKGPVDSDEHVQQTHIDDSLHTKPEEVEYSTPSILSSRRPDFTTKATVMSSTAKPHGEAETPDYLFPGHDDQHQVPHAPDFPGSYGTPPGGDDHDYDEEDQDFGPGTCRYGGKVYVSAQQIPRDDPCDFCFCFRSDIICLQQSCPPPIQHCHEEPIQGFCCPRYECPVSMATVLNVTTTTTTTTTTLPPHFFSHAYKGAAQRRGCQIQGQAYRVGEVVRSASGPCLTCTCGGDGQMKCDPKVCTPEPMLRQMIAVAATSRRR